MKSLFIVAMFFISFSLGGLVCDSCEASVQVVYNQLNSTDTKILEDVEQLCYVAPPLYYHLVGFYLFFILLSYSYFFLQVFSCC